MIQGLKIFKERFQKSEKPKYQKTEKQKLVVDFLQKLTQDNDILKKGVRRLVDELNEEKSKNSNYDSLY
jgi:uncharacterized protein YlxW (UPF0749 family)